MADNRPLSDNEVDDRLKAALNALGEAPGVTVAADTALTAARKALSLISLGLIAAGVKRELKARPQDSLATDRRTRSVGSLSSESEKRGDKFFISMIRALTTILVSENQRAARGCTERAVGRRSRPLP
jgi:hypothetical protein